MARIKIDTATTSLSFLPSIINISGNNNFTNAERIHKDYLFIPCHPSMKEAEVTRILKGLGEYRHIAENVQTKALHRNSRFWFICLQCNTCMCIEWNCQSY